MKPYFLASNLLKEERPEPGGPHIKILEERLGFLGLILNLKS